MQNDELTIIVAAWHSPFCILHSSFCILHSSFCLLPCGLLRPVDHLAARLAAMRCTANAGGPGRVLLPMPSLGGLFQLAKQKHIWDEWLC
jgi:hypothetical protein